LSHTFALASQLEIGFGVGEAARESFVRFKDFGEPLSLAEDFLGGFLVLPEVRPGDLLLNGLKFLAPLGSVKENSAGQKLAFSVRRIPFAVPRSRLLLNFCPKNPASGGCPEAVTRNVPGSKDELQT
jgi:hypothetical protein